MRGKAADGAPACQRCAGPSTSSLPRVNTACSTIVRKVQLVDATAHWRFEHPCIRACSSQMLLLYAQGQKPGPATTAADPFAAVAEVGRDEQWWRALEQHYPQVQL
eukprot:1156521-Pelagomonas_calceolata.AAC.2